MKTITKLFLGIFIITLFSCESDEPGTVAYGDAFIIAKTVGQETVYGLVLNASSNKNLIQVSASPHEDVDVSYVLTSSSSYSNDFYYETEEENYGSLIPQTGAYNFSATIEGNESISFSDNLTDDVLDPPSIVECIYDTTDERLEIEWDEDDDVDLYNIRIYNENDEMVFSSNGFLEDDHRVEITGATSGWLTNVTPEDGRTYTIELNAYLYEASKSDMNLQCKSSSTHDIVWGS